MQFSDLSVEVGHFYISDLHKEHQREHVDVERFIHRFMESGIVAVAPIVQKYIQYGKTVSMTVLIDDYFLPEQSSLEPEDLVQILSDYGSRHDLDDNLRLDHIVFESALAKSVEKMLKRLMKPPRLGDGSSEGKIHEEERWLSNGQTGRRQQTIKAPISALGMALESEGSEETDSLSTRHLHSLSIDVEMYQDHDFNKQRYACPTLAAWWQLIRLGMLRDDNDKSYLPEDTIVLKNRSLFAKRTLTTLNPRFLEIEAAVRTILSQVSIPSQWLNGLRDGRDRPKTDEHLRRISHIFIDETFHPSGLEKASSWT